MEEWDLTQLQKIKKLIYQYNFMNVFKIENQMNGFENLYLNGLTAAKL